MRYEVKVGRKKYEVEAAGENEQAIALISKAMDVFYKKEIKYKAEKEQYEIARYQMEQMFKKGNIEFGLKKVRDPYISVTFVPATDGSIEYVRQFSEKKARKLLKDIGLAEEEYTELVEVKKGKRKEYISVKAE